MSSRSKWGDVSYDLVKTDLVLPKLADKISLGPTQATDLQTDYIKVGQLFVYNQDPQIFGSSGETQVSIGATNVGKMNIITNATGLPINFIVNLPSGSDITNAITTANPAMTLSYGDAFNLSIINFATVSGHFHASSTTDSLVPTEATNANEFLPNTITQFTYIINPNVTPLSAIIVADIGVSKSSVDSALAAHVANHTDAHFGQDLTGTGAARFYSLALNSTAIAGTTANFQIFQPGNSTNPGISNSIEIYNTAGGGGTNDLHMSMALELDATNLTVPSIFRFLLKNTFQTSTNVVFGDTSLNPLTFLVVGDIAASGSLSGTALRFTSDTYSNDLTSYYAGSDGGNWGGAWGTIAQNLLMSKIGNTVTISAATGITATVATATAAVYSDTIPAWLRPGGGTNGGISMPVSWYNNSATSWETGTMNVNTSGTVSVRAGGAAHWTIGTVVVLGNWSITYNI